jgi:hypothetical protein
MEFYWIIGFLIWYGIGLYSFYYWWTNEHDITTDADILSTWALAGFMGVLSWYFGRRIHGKPRTKTPRILFKKRE